MKAAVAVAALGAVCCWHGPTTQVVAFQLSCGAAKACSLPSHRSRRRPHSAMMVSSGAASGSALTGMGADADERAAVNYLITYLCETSMNEWSPAVLEKHTPTLLRDNSNMYKQAMAARTAKVRSAEEKQSLEHVTAFLNGYLQQQRRRASRVKVQEILGAAVEGPADLDAVVSELYATQGIDSDIQEYVASLVETEERKALGKAEPSQLLSVLKTVQNRLQAELKTE
jgi:hypothetical protein